MEVAGPARGVNPGCGVGRVSACARNPPRAKGFVTRGLRDEGVAYPPYTASSPPSLNPNMSWIRFQRGV